MPQVVTITSNNYNVKNKNVHKNPNTKFLQNSTLPKINKGVFIHPYAIVIGDVTIDENVNVAPNAVIRADEGTPIFIGKNSNVQDGVVLHGLKDLYKTNNNKNYSVYIGENTSIAHQSQVHGPAKIGNNVFVGMQAFIYKSEIGNNVVIEPTAKVIGVKIADNKYVPSGEMIKTQDKADKLPDITNEYVNKNLNQEVVEVNKELAKGYLNQKYQKPSFNGRIKLWIPHSGKTMKGHL